MFLAVSSVIACATVCVTLSINNNPKPSDLMAQNIEALTQSDTAPNVGGESGCNYLKMETTEHTYTETVSVPCPNYSTKYQLVCFSVRSMAVDCVGFGRQCCTPMVYLLSKDLLWTNGLCD